MIALILAAGYGTRMYPLTKETPKALLPLGEKSILQYLKEKLEHPTLQTEKVVLVSNHKYAARFETWVKQDPSAASWQVLDDGSTSDQDRLGSVGDLGFAIQKAGIDQDLLVLGSDNLFKDSLDGFIAFARERDALTLGAYQLPDPSLASKYGVLSVDQDRKITSFLEKPKEPPSSMVSTAVYFFPRRTVSLVLEYASSQAQADTLGSFISWLIENNAVFAYPFEGPWFDIGDVASYKQAQESFVS